MNDVTDTRPTTVLIGALGGEGGGVLSNWLVDAADAAGLWVQATSVPGVAQRTGATTYYLEMGEKTAERDHGPVMALLPTPGNVDLLVASELLEAGRAAQGGMISPERTTVIASTHRLYAIAEKTAMGDGRFDTDRIVETVRALANRAVLGDLSEVTAQAGAVVSSVIFGAMAATEVLPFRREEMESAIEQGGIAVESNLRGFAAGYAFAQRALEGVPPDTGTFPATDAPPATLEHRVDALPRAVREFARMGLERTGDYQNPRYASRYMDRVERIAQREASANAASTFSVSNEVARYLALWMSYEDVIRVADLKTRPERLERVRQEVKAQAGQPVVITEFLKPGLEEWCAVLPPWLSRGVERLFTRLGLADRINVGLHVKTTSVSGFLLLWILARLRWWRPFTARFADEQARIERWLHHVQDALAVDEAFGLEVAQCANLVKGYGDTHARGRGNFDLLMGELAGMAEQDDPASQLRSLREAALADPEGTALAAARGVPGAVA